jgi:hypothetical protein
MSGFSAWTFTGAAGVAYRAGIAATGRYIGCVRDRGHAGGCAKRRLRRSRGIHPGLTRKEAARPSIDEVFPWVELCLAMVKTAGENAGRLLSAKN